MSNIELRAITKKYQNTKVIHGINLTVKKGEFIVLVGPSGCGKSTVLRMIAGLEKITSGKLYLDGQLSNNIQPSKRNLSMVFQSYALYPHMNVFNNLAFGLKMAKIPKIQIEQRVMDVAKALELEFLLKRYPKSLSGGQKQRVAIGKAIVRKPSIFLFDEPLSNLDTGLRNQTRIEIAKLHQKLGVTMIYVTHDQIEAMTLADRIVILNSGNIEQIGTPLEIYLNPKNKFVASFIGSVKMNFIKPNFIKSLPKNLPKNCFEIGIRPEDLLIAKGNQIRIKAKYDIAEQMGEYTLIHATLENNQNIIAKVNADVSYKKQDIIGFGFDEDKFHLFDKLEKRIEN